MCRPTHLNDSRHDIAPEFRHQWFCCWLDPQDSRVIICLWTIELVWWICYYSCLVYDQCFIFCYVSDYCCHFLLYPCVSFGKSLTYSNSYYVILHTCHLGHRSPTPILFALILFVFVFVILLLMTGKVCANGLEAGPSNTKKKGKKQN